MARTDKAKYLQIFDALQRAIRDGRYPQGVALPSDGALVRRYGVSRITVTKAKDELVRRGLVYRRRGSGTFVTSSAGRESGRLGLILPSLSFGEIFPSICQSLMRCAQADGYTFLLGDISAATPKARAIQACAVARSFVEQRVAGVILQPLAFLRRPERATQEILALFESARIPVVLIDRDIELKEERIRHDYVGIDNIAAGRALGVHLLEQGAKRVGFLMRPNCATVIRERLVGVRSARIEKPLDVKVIVADPSKLDAFQPWIKAKARPDSVVCESDYVAMLLRNTLQKLGLRVPEDVRLAGFDDVRYAANMLPPLTTVRQPCADLAKIAYRTLRERIADADLPPRRILLPAPLVIRESTRH